MHERKIKERSVREALKNPDAKRTMSDGITISQKNGLEIVSEIIKNKTIVITVYWL